jgi:hypothetical protein
MTGLPAGVGFGFARVGRWVGVSDAAGVYLDRDSGRFVSAGDRSVVRGSNGVDWGDAGGGQRWRRHGATDDHDLADGAVADGGWDGLYFAMHLPLGGRVDPYALDTLATIAGQRNTASLFKLVGWWSDYAHDHNAVIRNLYSLLHDAVLVNHYGNAGNDGKCWSWRWLVHSRSGRRRERHAEWRSFLGFSGDLTGTSAAQRP